MSLSKPAIVIVPGSFSPASMYDSIADPLRAAGYSVTAVDLPTVGDAAKATGKTLYDDARHIASITSKLADEGKDVVIVMHSYGGLAGSESAKGLAKSDREAAGKKGGIAKLVYITAMMAQVGDSCGSLLAENPDVGVIGVEGAWMYTNPESMAKLCFSDIPYDEGLRLTQMMPGHSAISFGDTLTYQAHKYIPATYMFCENDEIIPPHSQRSMIDKAVAEGIKVDVQNCASGHAPIASQPERCVEIIIGAASN